MSSEECGSAIDRPVNRIQLYNRIGYWLTQALVPVAIAAFGLTILWAVLGMREAHWSFYLMGGTYAIATLLWLAGFLVAVRENRLSDGNCHRCGGVIEGSPPEDVVMECEDCGQTWVHARTYDRGGM